jgi:hypothetical protein
MAEGSDTQGQEDRVLESCGGQLALTAKARIRLVGTPNPLWKHPSAECDPAIPLDRCDGMIVWGAPIQEFLTYGGVRAWYIDEALSHSMFRTRLFRTALKTVPENEFLHHSNPNPSYRFPCVTHYGEPTIANPEHRREAIVARSATSAAASGGCEEAQDSETLSF